MKTFHGNLKDLLLPDVLRIDDLSHHLGLSKTTIRRLLRQQVIAAVKISGRWYVDRRAVLAALAPRYGPRFVVRDADGQRGE